MNVLFCGPNTSGIYQHLVALGEKVRQTEDNLSGSESGEFLISHGFRHMIGKKTLDQFQERAINCHISYLPWNRGADPNLWSWIDETPKGVSLHLIDEGLDTGDIVTQTPTYFTGNQTLTTSYQALQDVMLDEFIRWWPRIRRGAFKAKPQETGGSYHSKADRAYVLHLLTRGWDTPINDIVGRRPH
jgi:methionyl-tRNA formyltransferase